MLAKIVTAIVSIIGALWLGIAGAAGMYWWDHREAGSPTWLAVNINGPLFGWPHIRWTPGLSLAAQRDGLARELASAQDQVAAIQAFDDALGHHIAQADTKAQVIIKTRYVTQIHEVPHYVTVQADRECVVPRGFIRLWNDASAAPDPGGQAAPSTPGADDSAPSGVVLSDIERAHISDAETYQSVAKRLRDLQDLDRKRAEGPPADASAKPTPGPSR